MSASTYYCHNASGQPKESFPSVHAARKALSLKRRFKSRRFPHIFKCPGCGGFHLTGGAR